MKQGIKHIYFILFAILLCANAAAQKFTAEISDKKVEAGQRFRITYSIENRSIDELTLPTVAAFSIVGGPNNGIGTYIFNGVKTQVSSISYDFVCKKIGKYTIPPATLKSKGKTYHCNALSVEIVKAGKKKPQTQPDPFNIFGSMEPMVYEEPIPVTNRDIFATLNVSDSKIYIGQPFTIDVRIYSRFQPVNYNMFDLPEFKDAWKQNLQLEGDTGYKNITINGITYKTAVLKRALYIPQFTGKYNLEAVKLGVYLRFAQRSGKLWEDIFKGGMLREERYSVITNSANLQVLDYPEENKPANFNGATGTFKMDVKTDLDSVPLDEPFTIKITITGSGNLSLMKAPPIQLPNDFEVYDPHSSDKLEAKTDSLRGSKTFEYIVIPHKVGNYTLSPVVFSYFNPTTEKYNTLISDSISIKVDANATSKDSSDAENDIRDLKPNVETSNFSQAGFPIYVYVVLLLILLFANIILWLSRGKIWDLINDKDKRKTKSADSVAVKRLKKAEEHLQSGNKRAFYEECHKAVLQYLQDKKGLQLSTISPEKIKLFLLDAGVGEELAHEAQEIISICEFARFAPPGNASELSDFHHRCIRFISNMEDKK